MVRKKFNVPLASEKNFPVAPDPSSRSSTEIKLRSDNFQIANLLSQPLSCSLMQSKANPKSCGVKVTTCHQTKRKESFPVARHRTPERWSSLNLRL
jgi:hypothetical protein